MADAEQPTFCTSRCAGELLNEPCRECGHLVALHVGVEHCPVCELVHLNQQARESSVTFDQVMRGEKTINDYRGARGLPPLSEPGIVVQIQASSPDENALRHVIERQMRRGGFGRT